MATKLVPALALQNIWDHVKGVLIPANSEFEHTAEFVDSLASINQCVRLINPE